MNMRARMRKTRLIILCYNIVVMMRKTGVGIEFLVFVSSTMSSEWTGKGKYYYFMFFVLVSM